MLNERFGMLRVVAEAGTNKHQKRLWRCICDCGGENVVPTAMLRGGITKSCGCLKSKGNRRTHGMHNSRAYIAWVNMKARCNDPNKPQYKDWGGRGITYDPRWNSFENFYADMGDPPEGMSLDRINNDGPYCKNNCRWETPDTQRRNSRQVRPVTIGDRTMLLNDWCKEFGLAASTVYRRINRGWSDIDALTKRER
jgi:hypothetical protein